MFDKPDFTRENFEELLRINNDLRRENNNLLGDIKNYHKDKENFLVDKENFIKDIEMFRTENNELKKELSNNEKKFKNNNGDTKIRPPALNAIYLLSKECYPEYKFTAKDFVKKLDSLAKSHDIVYSFQLKTVEGWCTEFKKMDTKQ
ncbi:hypothetical protein [Citrobacter sp. wls826]|uniref:hypothetical protein n=1 Tax=Citrobacter sp. wls826 TaxID=2576415 RepID=UPI0010C98A73|nr:hypothetical protein [Citrobacter sp. wls826]TKU21276.1 hypothetical protein FDW87_08775 [Citrobacter sp. wls826]TKV33411.1 hypothetical protein FDX20_10340 [Citrobacter sp. TBCS-11]